MHDHDLLCEKMWFKHLNAAAAFTVRRHLSAVIFIKLRHSQPLAPHRSLSHTRRTGVSSQNRCSPFELDSECGKSDYREGKLDSDVKGLKSRRGSVACAAGARSQSAAAAVGEAGEEEEQRLVPPPVVASSLDTSMSPHAPLCDWTGRHLRREHGFVFTGEATNSARLFGKLGHFVRVWLGAADPVLTRVFTSAAAIHQCAWLNRWLRGSPLPGPRIAWLNACLVDVICQHQTSWRCCRYPMMRRATIWIFSASRNIMKTTWRRLSFPTDLSWTGKPAYTPPPTL